MQVLTLILLVLMLSSQAAGVTIRVPEDAPTIQKAITLADNGDLIEIGAGTYRERLRVEKKNITLVGRDGPTRTVLDASGLGGSSIECMDVQSGELIIRGLTITGGVGSGARYGNEATIGGGVLVLRSSVLIENCRIHGNAATYEGGGIWAGDRSAIRVIDCQFIADRAERGGGVMVRGGRATIIGSVFNNVSAIFAGGGIAVEAGGMIRVGDCRFERCRASYNGGGVSIYDSDAVLVDSRFTQCHAGISGGAVYQGYNARLEQRDLKLSTIGDTVYGQWHGGMVPPKGACCMQEICIEVLEQACDQAGGRWSGPDTDCISVRAAVCPTPQPGDLNDDEAIDIHDLAILMSLWGAASEAAPAGQRDSERSP